MIDVRSETLLPLTDLPAYLATRGFGKLVSRRDVRKWATKGCSGAVLETIAIDRAHMTSLEAVQRWVVRQSGTLTSVAPSDWAATASEPPLAPAPATPEQDASMHLLTEHRLLATEVDQAIRALDYPRSTLAFAAAVLFRAGLRTHEDARSRGLAGLLAIKGLGARSLAVVGSLWESLQRKTAGGC